MARADECRGPGGGSARFSDLQAMFEYLTLDCPRCGRRSTAVVAALVRNLGAEASVLDMETGLRASCPRRYVPNAPVGECRLRVLELDRLSRPR